MIQIGSQLIVKLLIQYFLLQQYLQICLHSSLSPHRQQQQNRQAKGVGLNRGVDFLFDFDIMLQIFQSRLVLAEYGSVMVNLLSLSIAIYKTSYERKNQNEEKNTAYEIEDPIIVRPISVQIIFPQQLANALLLVGQVFYVLMFDQMFGYVNYNLSSSIIIIYHQNMQNSKVQFNPHNKLVQSITIFFIVFSTFWIYNTIRQYEELQLKKAVQKNSEQLKLNDSYQIERVLLVSKTPSLFYKDFLFFLSGQPQLSSIEVLYIWVVEEDEQKGRMEKQYFIGNVSLQHIISSQIVFINDASSFQWQRIYISNLAAIGVDSEAQQQIKIKIVQWIKQSDSFHFTSTDSKLFAFKRENTKDKLICQPLFLKLINESSKRNIQGLLGNQEDPLLLSLDRKQVSLFPTLAYSTETIFQYLTNNNLNILTYQGQSYPRMKVLELLISLGKVFSKKRLYLHAKMLSSQLKDDLIRNGVINELLLELKLIEQQNDEKGSIQLVTLSTLYRQLQKYRIKMITKKQKLIVIVALEQSDYLQEIMLEFKIVRLDQVNKLQHLPIKLERIPGVYLISKEEKVIQKNINSGLPYLFKKDYESPFTPTWVRKKQQPIPPQQGSCFFEQNSNISYLFSNKPIFTGSSDVLKNQFDATVFWCEVEGDSLFNWIGTHQNVVQIYICRDIDDSSRKRWRRMSVINDFSGKISEKSRESYNIAIISNEKLSLYDRISKSTSIKVDWKKVIQPN